MALEPDDDFLMAAYRGGDTSAFRQLYDRHQAGVYRFVKRLLGTDLNAQADEVFQEAWMRVINAAASYRPQGAVFRTWLFTIAHNCAVDRLRRLGRETSVEVLSEGDSWEPDMQAWEAWPSPTPHGEDVLFWRRAGERLLRCLEELPLAQKAAFLLHYDDGLSLDDVARTLKVEFEAAKSRLRYAISKLRICMGAYLDPFEAGG